MNKRLFLLVAGAALIASACVKVNMTIEVDDDGSGTINGLVAVDYKAFGDLANTFGDEAGFDQDQICSDFQSDSGLQGTEFDQVTPYNEGNFCGAEFSTRFDPGQLQTALGAMDAGLVTVDRQGDNWTFDLAFDAGDFDTAGTEGMPGFDDIFDGAEYPVRVKLPGKQADHNGDFIDNEGFVVWDIDLMNPPSRLFLETEPGDPIIGSQSAGGGDGGGGATTVIIIVGLVLVALGVAAYFITRNKKSAAAAQGAGADIAPQMPTAPPVADPGVPVQDFAPPAEPAATPPTPVAEDLTASADPGVIASPTPERATGEPVWDPTRRKYVQWDPNQNHWLVFDDATQAWTPET